VGERPLEQWEEQAWDSFNFEQAPPGYVQYNVPIKRTNDFLCLVFSCFTDPRAPASTDALLSLRVRRLSIICICGGREGTTLGGRTEAGAHTSPTAPCHFLCAHRQPSERQRRSFGAYG
jgi:hypothetical protein